MFRYSNLIFHESRLAEYREPLGARPTGVRFVYGCLRAASAYWASRVVLNGEGYHDELPAKQCNGWWEVELCLPDRPMVLWYYFKIGVEGENLLLWMQAGHTAGMGELFSNQPLSYQLTVYDKNFETPEFFKKAVMYQIFPDRYVQGNPTKVKEGIEVPSFHGKNGLFAWEF